MGGATNAGMSMTLGAACRELGLELYELLQGLDPARWRQERATKMRARLETLAAHARGIKARYEARGDADSELLAWCDELAETAEIGPTQPDANADTPASPADWKRLRSRLTRTYDNLSLRLRERGAPVPRNRPTNYMRNAYHMGNGLMIVLLIQLVLTPTTMILVSGGFVLTAWTIEFFRRRSGRVNGLVMRAFRDVAHPDEHYTVNSATWMVTALLFIALTLDPLSCAIGAAVLGFADPAAAIVGRRFGTRKLRGSKTLEGTLAFAIAAMIVAAIVMAIWANGLSLVTMGGIALLASVPSAIVELYSGKGVDDNFSIPVVAATGAWLGQLLLVG